MSTNVPEGALAFLLTIVAACFGCALLHHFGVI